MANKNTVKYFVLLETLKFKDKTSENNGHLEHNLSTLRKFVKEEPAEILQQIITRLSSTHLTAPSSLAADDNEACYVLYLQYVLLEIVANSNFNSDAKEDLISTRHINLCIEAVQDLAVYALRQQLDHSFRQASVFASCSTPNKPINYALLSLSVETFSQLLKVQQFHIANAMELVLRDYMAAIFTLFLGNTTKTWLLSDAYLKQLQEKLNHIWLELTKVEYMRNIMLLKGIPNLCEEIQRQLHQELLQKLLSKDGFTSLVATLQTAQSAKVALNDKQTFEIIANIVAFRGHTQRAQQTLIRQIFKFVELCLLHDAMLESMGAGLLSLRRLYELNTNNKQLIRQLLDGALTKLSQPIDLLSGLILMEHKEFALLIALLYNLFCTSTVECLPSELLTRYLPLLLQLYHHMPEMFLQKKQVASLVVRCLNNRSRDELQDIISKLYTLQFEDNWQQLHPRVLIYPDIEQTQLTLKVASIAAKEEFSASLALPDLLMSADHHILTYHVFMALLQLMATQLDDGSAGADEMNIALLQTEEELITYLNSKYPVKVEILYSLNALISYAPLKSQISENATECLQFLRKLIEKRLVSSTKHTEATDQTLLILLTLMQELLEQSQLPEAFRSFMPALQQLQELTPNLLIQQRISSLQTLLSGELKSNATQQTTAFNTARALIETRESHLQVYGIQMLLDLIRRRDAVTLSNTHVLIALALTTLKDKESYTFLNCVRLFAALVHVVEAEVLEILSDEYLNEHVNIDYRLVVGEAILKVSQELGPLSYKYKDVLLNCFMHGARSPLNEFRMSSFANLAQLARTLCYQVQNFFQELLHLIDCELSSGQYLPAKRAAILVLSELLEGMDNLIDFEDMLLPIYRLLKTIEANEQYDEKMRVHAANGLKALAVKCKKLLFPEQPPQLQKEIRILGINEPEKKASGKKHILELN